MEILRLPTLEELEAISVAMRPGNIGVHVLKSAINQEYLLGLPDLGQINWRDNHKNFINARGIEVVQQHLVYALKVKQGDPEIANQNRFMIEMAKEVSRLLRYLSGVFPALENWDADEVSMHRYDQPEVGLSRHRDNLRYWGMIAIATLEGSSDFVVYSDGAEVAIEVENGDLALMRAANLVGDPQDAAAQTMLCPEHAVLNVRTLPRTSLIVRDNLRPDESVSGFEYANWSTKY